MRTVGNNVVLISSTTVSGNRVAYEHSKPFLGVVSATLPQPGSGVRFRGAMAFFKASAGSAPLAGRTGMLAERFAEQRCSPSRSGC